MSEAFVNNAAFRAAWFLECVVGRVPMRGVVT